MGVLAYRVHQLSMPIEGWRWAVGMRRGSDLYYWSVRTSASTGAPGSPTRRESCATVISVGEGMAASTSEEDMDAMFRPRPHGAIAVAPLLSVHISATAKSILWSRAQFLKLPHVVGGLGHQPIAESHNLWQGRRRLWTNDPIGFRQA